MTREDIKTALLAAIDGAGLSLATVAAFSTRDIGSESGDIVVVKPAALVIYQGSSFSGRNLPNTLYQDLGTWDVLVVTEELAGGDKPHEAALSILDGLIDTLGGLKITGPSGRAMVKIIGVEPGEARPGLATYSLVLEIDADLFTHP